MRRDLKEFVVANSRVRASGCWEWVGGFSGEGYGSVHIHHVGSRGAHRVSYAVFIGLVPKGLGLDHLCRNRACVNPWHLEPVTDRVNILRGESPSAVNARKTHCNYGHAFTEENTARDRRGRRSCKECRKRNNRKYRAARAALSQGAESQEVKP